MLEYLLIVLVKTFEVSLGTLRIKLITRGQRVTGAMVAFVEIIIWLLVVGRVLSDMDDPGKILAYALGYATGNFMGVLVEEWIGLGSTKVEVVISRKNAADVVHQIRELGFGVTVIDAEGRDESRNMLIIIIPRRCVPKIRRILMEAEAFVTITDIKPVYRGIGGLKK
ncbi:MAG: DUF2179 domain-containing protein [Peptoniphilaceae bacterium]|jgi:uncharacterized protein YebE (UPF0316 family)|nr:DUF5698 domain-containing protein [Bacillota bacterium]